MVRSTRSFSMDSFKRFFARLFIKRVYRITSPEPPDDELVGQRPNLYSLRHLAETTQRKAENAWRRVIALEYHEFEVHISITRLT
jgi:hypothetical protein